MPLTTSILQEFGGDIFIETGTYLGDGCQAALDNGFKEVHSIEMANEYYLHSKERFKSEPRVHLYHGNTKTSFQNVIKNINKQAVFWLDAHMIGQSQDFDHTTPCPLLEEITHIKSHPIKTHTILIDDMRMMNGHGYNVYIDNIITALKEINSNYKIEYRGDDLDPCDILCAYI